MWYYTCASCGTFIRVTGDVEEHQRLLIIHPMWEHGRKCFSEGCGGLIVGPIDTNVPEIRNDIKSLKKGCRRFLDLDPQQLFRALCGGGTPEEVEVRVEVVRAFLLSSKIIKVIAHEMMGDHRVIMDRLYLDNGTILHFAGTGAGALIYKVTKDVQASSGVGVQPETGNGVVRRAPAGADTDPEGEVPAGDDR